MNFIEKLKKQSAQRGFTPLLLILGCLILLLVLAGIFGYLALNNQKTATPVSTPAPRISSPTPSAKENPTATSEPKNGAITVSLGQQFTLKNNEVAKIVDTGLEIEITEFFNSPCPPGYQCFWSGVGIGLEYRLNGEIQKGINLVKAFGYQTTIVQTDNETYADLVVEKMKQNQDLSTPELIEQAFAKGEITTEQRLLYLAYAVGDFEKLPAQYRGNSPWRSTMVLAELTETVNSPSVMCTLNPFSRSELRRVLRTNGAKCSD